MNPKIAAFLRTHTPATPCLVLDLDRVETNYRRIMAAMPQARVYYAVKANPAAPILARLAGLGSSFDAASFEEVEACLAAGADPALISYGNTVKKESAIRAAFDRGVTMFAFDSEPELRKIARAAPGARVYCRIFVGNDGAEWPLSRKFGCEVAMAKRLMVLAEELGLDAYGISFHVGSQQTTTGAYEAAIAKVAASSWATPAWWRARSCSSPARGRTIRCAGSISTSAASAAWPRPRARRSATPSARRMTAARKAR
jgi:ornithine decarboxylase